MRLILACAAAVLALGTTPRTPAPKVEVVLVPAGSFVMGSEVESDERPTHRVTFAKPFYIGKYEVTQAQWAAVMEKNPSQFQGGDLPVERVTWDEAVTFCARLSSMTGKTYRLPTEAEWEYACRAGSDARWCFGDSGLELERYAWFDDNSLATTHAVGKLRPNAWGIHDMHGNAWEWCADWYDPAYYASSPSADPHGPPTGDFRVLRGGSYGGGGGGTRSANRFYATGDIRFFASGLRVVLVARK